MRVLDSSVPEEGELFQKESMLTCVDASENEDSEGTGGTGCGFWAIF